MYQDKYTSTAERLDHLRQSFPKYIKILILYFILPLWIVITIHGGAVAWKIWTWVVDEVHFLQNTKYIVLTIAVFFFPIAYLVWCYYLTVQKALRELYHDLLKDWNIDFGRQISDFMIQRKFQPSSDYDLTDLINSFNERISHLPSLLGWLVRKIIDQIPLVEIVNTLEITGEDEESRMNLANRVTDKLNEVQVEAIESIVSRKMLLIIPLDVLLLWVYITL